jgi:hypothetical protein
MLPLSQKEPLSRSLKGRPFEHEEFYEILFNDVIGSGGAPKRITKPRRKGPDPIAGSAVEPDVPGSGIVHLLNESLNAGVQSSPVAVPTAVPRSTTNVPVPPQARPTQTTIPPRTSIASTSALTPPDETLPHARKRFAPAGDVGGPADKRRRTAGAPAAVAASTAPSAVGSVVVDTTQQSAARGDGVALLADALAKAANGTPKWPEQAMAIFFHDFADEDKDLQIKIAEKVLTDPNKAAMFVTMPVALRKHYVKRLREVYHRTTG